MNLKEREEFAREKFEETSRLLLKKGADYGECDDANINFKQAGRDLGMTPGQVLYVYFHKHLRSLTAFIKNGKLESEPIDGRIADMITYLYILWSMIDESEGNRDDKGLAS